MLETLDKLDGIFAKSTTLESATDVALDMVKELGFGAIIYDYSPVAVTFKGELITPSQICMRNVPSDMLDLWCKGGFYQIDPVQKMALKSTAPFIWSVQDRNNTTGLERYLSEENSALVSYLQDSDLTFGVTVPMQRVSGELATYTVMQRGTTDTLGVDALHNLASLNMIAQVFHEHVYSLLNDEQRQGNFAHLSPREKECLRYCADGFSAKEISHRLDRAIPTITQHLQSAAKKLGARNRVHAVMLAHHYRLLETH